MNDVQFTYSCRPHVNARLSEQLLAFEIMQTRLLESHDFYPRDAMLARVIAIATCLSVRPSVRHAAVLCENEER